MKNLKKNLIGKVIKTILNAYALVLLAFATCGILGFIYMTITGEVETSNATFGFLDISV